MPVVFVDGFDWYNDIDNHSGITLSRRHELHCHTLAKSLVANTRRVIKSGIDDRAGFNYIGDEGAFSVEPIQGNPYAWQVVIIQGDND